MVWFIPMIPPIKEFIPATNARISTLKDVKVIEINIIGAIFCQVDKISLLDHLIHAITDGNQKKVGNLPSFNSKDSKRVILNKFIILNEKNIT